MMTPFAIDLYEQYLAGKTPERLAFENGIPVERIELRLRVAAAGFIEQHTNSALVN